MKMKSILVSMLAVATLASCQKDDVTNGGGENNVPAGVATYATFNFNVEGSKPGTRAGHMAENADEEGINDIRLLVFDGVAPDAELLINQVVDHATQSATVATTSGPKRVFVVANSKLNTTLNGLDEGTTKLTEFYALMTDKSTGTVPNPDTDMGDGFKSMLQNSSMFMSNVADVSSLKDLRPNITEDASKGPVNDNNNHFEFYVKRSVAKGNLLVEVAEADIVTKDGIFTFGKAAGDITYAVRNVNRSVNYIQQFVGGHGVTSIEETDAHKQEGVRPTAPYYNQFDGVGVDLTKLSTYAPYYFNGYDITAANAGIGVGGAAGVRTTNVYFTENSNNNQVRGNTSFFAIATKTAKIAKEKIAADFAFDAATGSLSTTADGVDYTTGNFWFIREIPVAAGIKFTTPADNRRVFVDEDKAFEAIYVVLTRANIIKKAAVTDVAKSEFVDAAALKTAYNAGTLSFDMHQYFGKYTNGVSYYRLNIYETIDGVGTKRHLVRRNHAYLAKVTGFNELGEPTEDDLNKDPEKPVDAETTHITATIRVQQWHVVNMEDEL